MISLVDMGNWATGILGAGKALSLDLPGGESVIRFEWMSKEPLTIYGVSKDGEMLLLAHGSTGILHRRLVGFAGLNVEGPSDVSYRCSTVNANDVLDPTPIALQADTHVDHARIAAIQLVREEIARLKLNEHFADDEAVAEFLEDLESGDDEFEDEPDMFGLTAHEMLVAAEERERRMKEILAEREEAEKDDTVTDPPAEQPAAPAAPAPASATAQS